MLTDTTIKNKKQHRKLNVPLKYKNSVSNGILVQLDRLNFKNIKLNIKLKQSKKFAN